MPLFLYNFETKELHGIFKAASDGDWEIDPCGAGSQAALPWRLAIGPAFCTFPACKLWGPSWPASTSKQVGWHGQDGQQRLHAGRR
jgi:hypothetical protein